MGDQELGSVFRGLARDAAAAGRNAAESMAKLTDRTAETEEENLAAMVAADTRAADRFAAAGMSLIEDGRHLEETSSRGPWPVSTGVSGPAKGRQLTAPNRRHTISGAKHGEVKGDNTVALRGYEDVLKDDTKRIAAGQASFNPVTQLYAVNGRTYRVKGTGTVFPVAGTGLVQLSRTEYAALQALTQADGEVGAVREFQYNPVFRSNPDAIAKAKSIYDGTYAP